MCFKVYSAVFQGPCCVWVWGGGCVRGGGGVLLNLPSPLMAFFLNLYVIDIHHILTFQTSGDTWPAAFHCYFD